METDMSCDLIHIFLKYPSFYIYFLSWVLFWDNIMQIFHKNKPPFRAAKWSV